MKLVLQRVARASVTVGGEKVSEIARGLLVLFGAERGDGPGQADYLAEKTANLRIFPDPQGNMNLSCKDISGGVLVVSQFTLAGSCEKGRRPSFDRAARPEDAVPLYERFVQSLAAQGLSTLTGRFGADMQVELVNDGPVTFILEK